MWEDRTTEEAVKERGNVEKERRIWKIDWTNNKINSRVMNARYDIKNKQGVKDKIEDQRKNDNDERMK